MTRAAALLCLAACQTTAQLATTPPAPRAPEATAAPAGNQGELDRRLAAFRSASWSTPGERARAESELDAFAGQRYATVSGLYWYRDRAAALAEAQRSGKPILSLHLLGRLDEDYSCANSRFFRVALYADPAIARTLHDDWVLLWTSERPAPRVTIDFGDGRVMHRTIAGNSAHVVLDSLGRPVDVLPGLYAPGAFLAELQKAHPLAVELAKASPRERYARLARWHQGRYDAAAQAFAEDGGLAVSFGSLRGSATLDGAERVVVGKGVVERPLVQRLELGPQLPAAADPGWVTLGQRWRGLEALSAPSKALIARLAPVDWSTGKPLTDQSGLVARFEASLLGDTAAAEYAHRAELHRWFAASDPTTADEAQLCARMYRELFLTPASDPWLGMATPDVLSGLPGDGLE